jgi:hypothetical protein
MNPTWLILASTIYFSLRFGVESHCGFTPNFLCALKNILDAPGEMFQGEGFGDDMHAGF